MLARKNLRFGTGRLTLAELGEFVTASVYEHTVVFERVVNGHVHRFKYSMDCRLHSDIYEAILDRALRRDVEVDINSLIDSAVEKTEDGFPEL